MSSRSMQHFDTLSALEACWANGGAWATCECHQCVGTWGGVKAPVRGEPGHAAARVRKQALQQHRCSNASSRFASCRRGTMTLNS